MSQSNPDQLKHPDRDVFRVIAQQPGINTETLRTGTEDTDASLDRLQAANLITGRMVGGINRWHVDPVTMKWPEYEVRTLADQLRAFDDYAREVMDYRVTRADTILSLARAIRAEHSAETGPGVTVHNVMELAQSLADAIIDGGVPAKWQGQDPGPWLVVNTEAGEAPVFAEVDQAEEYAEALGVDVYGLGERTPVVQVVVLDREAAQAVIDALPELEA